ncbi:MAG: hypothetical protein AAF493_11860 [Pseudomonadota bacterium]
MSQSISQSALRATRPPHLALSGVDIALLIGFACLGIAFTAFSWRSGTAGFMADDALYLLMADRVLTDHPDPVHLHAWEATHFPPLWPWLLSLFGAGSEHVARAHAITSVCFIAGLALHAGWGATLARQWTLPIVVCGALLFLPGMQFFALEIWSEFLYMALTGAALWACARGHYLAAALICGLAFLSRSAGIALLGAYALFLLWHRPPGFWRYGLVAIALPAIWVVYNAAEPSQDAYLTMLWRSWHASEPGSAIRLIGELVDKAIATTLALWQGWLHFLSIGPTVVIAAIGIGLVVPAIWGFIHQLRRVHFDAIYVVLYVAMIYIWSHDAHAQRFLLPLLPIFAIHALIGFGVGQSSRALDPHRTGPESASHRPGVLAALIVGWFVGFAACVLPDTYRVFERAARSAPSEVAQFTRTRYWLREPSHEDAMGDVAVRAALISHLRTLPTWVARDSCVYSIHPQLTMLYANVVSYPPGPHQGAMCRYHYVMRHAGFDAELLYAKSRGQVIAEQTMPDGTPLGTLVEYR